MRELLETKLLDVELLEREEPLESKLLLVEFLESDEPLDSAEVDVELADTAVELTWLLILLAALETATGAELCITPVELAWLVAATELKELLATEFAMLLNETWLVCATVFAEEAELTGPPD